MICVAERPYGQSFRCHVQFDTILDIGAVAQLGERLPCTEEVRGSNPLSSTKVHHRQNSHRLSTPAAWRHRHDVMYLGTPLIYLNSLDE